MKAINTMKRLIAYLCHIVLFAAQLQAENKIKVYALSYDSGTVSDYNYIATRSDTLCFIKNDK